MKRIRIHENAESCTKGYKMQGKTEYAAKISFQCSHCDYKSPYFNILRSHEATHKVDKPHLKCNQCHHLARNTTSLKVHKKVHTASKSFICDTCGYASSRENNLRRHRIRHVGEAERKLFLKRCPYAGCSYKSVYRDNLNSHLRNHANVRPFKCQLCKYTARYSGNLKRHMFSHATGKEREELWRFCQVQNCCYRTVYCSDLKKHMRRHSAGDPAMEKYRCNNQNGAQYQRSRRNKGNASDLNDMNVLVKQEVVEEEGAACVPRRNGMDAVAGTSGGKKRLLASVGARVIIEDVMKGAIRNSLDGKKSVLNGNGEQNRVNANGLKGRESIAAKETMDVEEPAFTETKNATEMEDLMKVANSVESKDVKIYFRCRRNAKMATTKASNGRKRREKVSTSKRLANVKIRSESTNLLTCKLCCILFSDNKLVALHNEEAHSVPYVVIELLPKQVLGPGCPV